MSTWPRPRRRSAWAGPAAGTTAATRPARATTRSPPPTSVTASTSDSQPWRASASTVTGMRQATTTAKSRTRNARLRTGSGWRRRPAATRSADPRPFDDGHPFGVGGAGGPRRQAQTAARERPAPPRAGTPMRQQGELQRLVDLDAPGLGRQRVARVPATRTTTAPSGSTSRTSTRPTRGASTCRSVVRRRAPGRSLGGPPGHRFGRR